MRKDILATVPRLRAFAISLSGKPDHADDLVQETLVRAFANFHHFEPGTNLQAWLFTILRNQFRSEYRKRRHEVEDIDGRYSEALATPAVQHCRLEFQELRRALMQLPDDQREAVLLTAASGFSHEYAAQICGCPVGTIKSRVHRARARLAAILSIDIADKQTPDRDARAAAGP